MILFMQAILYVADVTKAMEFYRNAFGFQERFIHESKGYGEIESDTVALAFASKKFVKSHLNQPFKENSLKEPCPPFEIAFICDNVQETYENAVAAGAVTIHEPEEKPWGQTVAYVRDIDGFLLEIGSRIES